MSKNKKNNLKKSTTFTGIDPTGRRYISGYIEQEIFSVLDQLVLQEKRSKNYYLNEALREYVKKAKYKITSLEKQIEQTKEEIAEELLLKDISLETIAEVTGINIERVKELKLKTNNKTIDKEEEQEDK